MAKWSKAPVYQSKHPWFNPAWLQKSFILFPSSSFHLVVVYPVEASCSGGGGGGVGVVERVRKVAK